MAEVRHKREIEAAQEAIKSQPGNEDLEVRLAENYLAAGQEEKGLTLLQNLVTRNPAVHRLTRPWRTITTSTATPNGPPNAAGRRGYIEHFHANATIAPGFHRPVAGGDRAGLRVRLVDAPGEVDGSCEHADAGSAVVRRRHRGSEDRLHALRQRHRRCTTSRRRWAAASPGSTTTATAGSTCSASRTAGSAGGPQGATADAQTLPQQRRRHLHRRDRAGGP